MKREASSKQRIVSLTSVIILRGNGTNTRSYAHDTRSQTGRFVVVIDWFLAPGRLYPVQVYLYACGLYRANPAMGQRAVVKATRAEFGLESFRTRQ